MKPTQEQLNDTKWWDENIPEWVNHYNTMDGSIYTNEPDIGQEPFCVKRPTKPAFVPEVGVECELVPKDLLWFEENGPCYVKPVAIKDGEIWLKGVNCKINTVLTIDEHEFRPIKSERELFVEKVRELHKAHHWTIRELAEALYDSGLFCLKETEK